MPAMEYGSENTWTTALLTDIDESRQHNADWKRSHTKLDAIWFQLYEVQKLAEQNNLLFSKTCIYGKTIKQRKFQECDYLY